MDLSIKNWFFKEGVLTLNYGTIKETEEGYKAVLFSKYSEDEGHDIGFMIRDVQSVIDTVGADYFPNLLDTKDIEKIKKDTKKIFSEIMRKKKRK